MTIKVKLNEKSIDQAIKRLEKYQRDMDKKCKLLARKLAEMGATNVALDYSRAQYNGSRDINVSVRRKGNGFVIIASGETVLFVEFGTGVRYSGTVHPMSSEFGYGAGTYPYGKGHWDSPYGWWYPSNEAGENQKTTSTGKTYSHTYGNPPSMTMYNTSRELRDRVLMVAKEVFRT